MDSASFHAVSRPLGRRRGRCRSGRGSGRSFVRWDDARRRSPAAEPNRWAVLALLGVAQLMVVLDSTIVNIALPSAQPDLGFSTGEPPVDRHRLRAGVRQPAARRRQDRRPLRAQVDVHRRPDRLLRRVVPRRPRAVLRRPRRRASAAGRRSARCSAPSALSLLTVTFADSPERAKAFGIFAAVATAGASVGLLLGGLLTDALSWRWCLYVEPAHRHPGRVLRAAADRQRDAAAAAAHRLRRRRARVRGPLRDRLRVLQGRDGLLAGAGDESSRSPRASCLLVAFVLVRAARSTSRCCRCTSCGTARAAAPMPRSPSPARASSPSSCSSRSSCSRTSATRR